MATVRKKVPTNSEERASMCDTIPEAMSSAGALRTSYDCVFEESESERKMERTSKQKKMRAREAV